MTLFNRFIRYERRFAFRDRTNFRAICLIDFGATRSAVHQPFSDDTLHRFVRSHRITSLTPSPARLLYRKSNSAK
jgi:hypothetical protein